MKIRFLINTSEPFYHGGYEARAWDFARALVRQQHEVTIYTSCDAPQEMEGVKFRPLAPTQSYFNQRGVRNLWADGRFTLGVLKLLGEKERPDILDVCATPYLHLPATKWVTRRWGVPLVATVHEALLHAIDDYVRQRGVTAPTYHGLYAKLLRGIYQRGLRAADHLLAVSANTAEGLEKEGYQVSETVEYGLNFSKFPEPQKAPSQERPWRFIWVGRLTAHKKVETALLALHAMGQDGLRYHFDIVGTGAELPHLRAVAQGLGIAQHVHLHGFVSAEQKRELLAQADCLLMTSPREGFSIATLEAMASGCAVLAANPAPPATPSAVVNLVTPGENGQLYEVEPEKLTLALQALRKEPEQLTAWQKAARQRARQYDIDQQATKLAAFYQRCLKK